MNNIPRSQESSVLPQGFLVSSAKPEQIWPLIRSGRITLRDIAKRLVQEGAADLIPFDDACELLSEMTLDLEMNGFFLTPRRATTLLKDALFALDSGWSERQLPRYEPLPPPGVSAGQYFAVTEAVELIGATVRMRPETPGADLVRVGLVRTMQQIYPCHWILGVVWDRGGGGVFFDRADFDMLVVVDESFSM